jgi:hypothetical protein
METPATIIYRFFKADWRFIIESTTYIRSLLFPKKKIKKSSSHFLVHIFSEASHMIKVIIRLDQSYYHGTSDKASRDSIFPEAESYCMRSNQSTARHRWWRNRVFFDPIPVPQVCGGGSLNWPIVYIIRDPFIQSL